MDFNSLPPKKIKEQIAIIKGYKPLPRSAEDAFRLGWEKIERPHDYHAFLTLPDKNGTSDFISPNGRKNLDDYPDWHICIADALKLKEEMDKFFTRTVLIRIAEKPISIFRADFKSSAGAFYPSIIQEAETDCLAICYAWIVWKTNTDDRL